jgi:hypothetical protein
MAQNRVFISSVIKGFERERGAARRAVESLRQQPVMAEDFGAKPHSAQTACLEGVRSSHIYVGILGERYGFVAQSGFSVTEEEFLEARRCGLRVLLFNQNGPKEARQQDFLDRIKKYEDGYHLDFFTTPDELTDKVTKALFDEIGQPNVSALNVASAAEHFERHRWGHRPSSDSNSWLAAVFLPTRYGEEYLSALDLGQAESQDRLLQQALFGPGAFFRKDVGNTAREGATHLILEQQDEHRRPVAFLEAWTDGTLICGAALGARGGREFGLVSSMVIDQDEVERLVAAFCYYADLFYRGVNQATVIASLYVGVTLTGLQYKSFGRLPAVEPHQITMPISNLPDPVRVPQQPLKVARAELAAAPQLAHKLTELAARTFRAAGAYYSPRK